MRKCVILTSLIMSISMTLVMELIIFTISIPSLDVKEHLLGLSGMVFGFFIILFIANAIIGIPFLVYVKIRKIQSILAFIVAGVIFSALIAYYFYPIFDSPHLKFENKSYAPFLISITISLGVVNCVVLWWLAIRKGLLK